MENVTGKDGLALQQFFSITLLKINEFSFFNDEGLKLNHFDIFNMLFPFLAFVKLYPIIV